ncbi:glycosyltransferase family 4 protein [Candidatus Pacebacteria bacterium]|nr:glycosyltransferase family 4 protein [Candidatus Paceibacterota bacterium]
MQETIKKPKRVLIFSLDYLPGTISGAESAIEDITERISPEEIEFHMVTLYYDSMVKRVQKIGNVRIHYVGLFGKPNATLQQRRSFPLHYNKHYFQFAAGIKAYFLHRKYKYNGAWAMMAHGTGVPVSIFNILTGVPYALSLQEGDPPEYIEKTMRPLWPLFKRSFTHATVLQSISAFLADWGKRMGYTKEIVIIPDGANPDSIRPSFDQLAVDSLKMKLGKKEGEIFIGNTARLVEQKGFDTTIRALPNLPAHVRLLIVGGGPEEESLKALVQTLDLADRVIFTGQVERSVVSQYRHVMDIFVGPSRSEGLGHAFLSAMACRLPVVATQVGGMVDFLHDTKRNPDKPPTGFAVDPDSPEQIVATVLEILDNPEKTKQIVDTAHAMVLREYDWDIIAKNMQERVFNSLWDK